MKIKYSLCLLFLLVIHLKPLKADNSTSEPVEIFNGYDIYATTIIREGNVWKQWFGGWMTQNDLPWDRMYYSFSEDSGKTWAEPIEIFTIEKVQVNDPSVIKLWDNENSRSYYQMYYTYYPSGYGDETNYIAVSTSLDGINWTHLGNQEKGVLIGADNGIDMAGAWAPSVVSLDSLGNEIYLYFHNNIPTGVYRTSLSGKGLVFNKETTIMVSSGFKVNVDVSIAPDSTWWMFYNSPGTFENGEGKFETSKMYSEKGIHWKESIYNPTLAFPDNITVTPHIVWEDSINYQLWYGLGPSIVDFDVYVQNFQLEAEPFLPVVASSEALSVLGPENSIDGDNNTFWASQGYVDDIHNEWIYLDFDEVRDVYQIILAPRLDGDTTACFPTDFSIQYSQNGFDWTDILGHSYTNYARADILPNIFTLDEAVTAQFIRINASRLKPDSYNNFYFQLAEFEVIHELSEVILNNNPYLSSIKVNDNEISGFRPDIFEYDVMLAEGSNINTTTISIDTNAEVTISQETDKITILVRAENQFKEATYVLHIKFLSSNTNLSSIEVNGTELGNFSPQKFEYEIEIDEGTSVVVTATPEDSSAKVQVSEHTNVFTIRVIAENNMDVANYYVNINYITAIEPIHQSKIQIFPNPASDELTISNAENATISVYTLRGKLVYNAKYIRANHTIKLGEYLPGLYIIKIYTSDFIKCSKILLIN